jgi:hypothetical protein
MGRETRFALALVGAPALFLWLLPATALGQGLSYSLDEKGLASLTYNRESFFALPRNGRLRAGQPVFAGGGDGAAAAPTATNLDEAAQQITLTFPWGKVANVYGQTDDRLTMRVQVSNDSDKVLARLPVVVAELNFREVPKGASLEAGMFGAGFKGGLYPLGLFPVVADPRYVVPMVQVDYGTGTLNFSSDDVGAEVNISRATNPPAGTMYAFTVSITDIAPRATKICAVSLRFGSPNATVRDLSGDVLERYAQTYPFQLKWEDRRPIGMIFLASSGINVPANPRRWIMKAGKLDVTTDEGKAAFREALLDLADRSIELLKETKAQGMITWDPEGQEFPHAVYYGDPRLTPVLAPEMEFKGEGNVALVDEYFQKFRRAGLKVGVCLRPQEIKMVNGKPVQGVADNQRAEDLLKKQIAYAKERWGCTFFYVDSTTTAQHGPLDPGIFESLAKTFPDVLLMPENESMRYFAYTAPLNSYMHHRITSTPAGARAVYPRSFSVLMTLEGDKPEDGDALRAAVRHGDILLFNCWYKNPGAEKVKKIYSEAVPNN